MILKININFIKGSNDVMFLIKYFPQKWRVPDLTKFTFLGVLVLPSILFWKILVFIFVYDNM